jgi:3-phosphoshikimate 1-carboxyvinyltransferase
LKTASEPLSVRGEVSSQFLTALLLAAPLLARERGMATEIKVIGELISRPYVDITLNLLRCFGIAVQRQEYERFSVAATQYRSPGSIRVEGDASSASYFLALGLLGGGPVTVRGIDAQSIQGDIGFARFLEECLGACVQWGAGEVTVSRSELGSLPAFDRDFNDIPDAAMTAAVLALYANGPCTLRNIASWRVKETDRIAAMAIELRKLGAGVIERPDSLTVTPPVTWRSARISTYDDHRMAMCFSLATFGGVTVSIEDPDCVRKTFPEYFGVRAALVS